MNEIVLRDYQQKFVDDIIDNVSRKNSVLCVLATGGGKSIVIADLSTKLVGRTLILTHRIEILKQNASKIDMNNIGLVTAKHTVKKDAKIIVAMVETFHSRIKKFGRDYAGEFDNIIIDEAHIQSFNKVYETLDYKKLIGFTATPIINKKEVIKIDDIEHTKIYTMGDYYDTLVEGIQVSELITKGFLTPERAYTLKMPNFSRLKERNNEYTTDSLNDVYANKASRKVLFDAYNKLCRGKKTLIFNATTKVNKEVEDLFIGMGIDVKSYDSVNNDTKDRERIINWFRKSEGGVLIGTNVFTTGFDVSDIEVVIVNRATKSFSLWIQMVGRGSRIAEGKNDFIVIDLGQNIDAFGKWSNDINWQNYFETIDPILKKKVDILNVWECKKCGAYNVESDKECVICGAEKAESKKVAEYNDKNGELISVDESAKPPTSAAILDYCERTGNNANFAFKLLEGRMMLLFSSNDITKEYYLENREKLEDRVRQIYRPIYFGIIRSDLEGKNRKLSTQLDRMYKKINNLYE